MAEVSGLTATRLPGVLSWRLSWSGSGTFYVYVDGFLYTTTTRTWYDVPVPAGAVLAVQVFDSSSDTPDDVHPCQFVFFWERSPDAVHYRIERYVDAAWSVVHRVHERGQWIYNYRTAVLEDETEHQYRIVPVGSDGREGTAKTFTIKMVRRPDRPTQTITYDSGTGMLSVE